jgi:hypothetical protein
VKEMEMIVPARMAKPMVNPRKTFVRSAGDVFYTSVDTFAVPIHQQHLGKT